MTARSLWRIRVFAGVRLRGPMEHALMEILDEAHQRFLRGHVRY